MSPDGGGRDLIQTVSAGFGPCVVVLFVFFLSFLFFLPPSARAASLLPWTNGRRARQLLKYSRGGRRRTTCCFLHCLCQSHKGTEGGGGGPEYGRFHRVGHFSPPLPSCSASTPPPPFFFSIVHKVSLPINIQLFPALKIKSVSVKFAKFVSCQSRMVRVVWGVGVGECQV